MSLLIVGRLIFYFLSIDRLKVALLWIIMLNPTSSLLMVLRMMLRIVLGLTVVIWAHNFVNNRLLIYFAWNALWSYNTIVLSVKVIISLFSVILNIIWVRRGGIFIMVLGFYWIKLLVFWGIIKIGILLNFFWLVWV